MLTPHELAQLFVIVNAPVAAHAASPELETLVEQDLVQCVARIGESIELRVTARGAEVLARLARGAAPSRPSAIPAR
ncbi:MAG: hypothetical protein EPN57_22055 [Paraburkholderia sp.]|nr:MAG: hypothetical protein EPN57_22055 [Paraburkholderia sp.]